tara:strand:+ start:1417 stop:2076 length:660 start_codon:yes stop_codon:yes gene_type:complete
MDDNSHKKTARTPSEQKTVDLSDDFIINWKVNMAGRRSFYLRDKQVSCLLINYSKKGSHSFAYDYRHGKTHKSKVFGYFPAMTTEDARIRAIEIDNDCIKNQKSYDDLFEIHRLPRMVYFLMTTEGEIKIGRSTDIYNRIQALVMHNSGLYLLGFREESKFVNESKLHYLYRAFRIKGSEYFKKNDYLLDLIARFCVFRDTDVQIARLMGQQDIEIYQK